MTTPWPNHPSIYEINTWVWLGELTHTEGRTVTLASVPDREWDALAQLGFDVIWLMGVWERSPAGTAIANRNQGLMSEFRHVLPDFHAEDNVGSPYCIRNYRVDRHLGGPEGLSAARQALGRRGMRLMLDFVPNHVAPDHPWATEHPEYFVHGTLEDLARDPASFVRVGQHVIACGRDPFFPAWSDVLQLNAFSPELRAAAAATVCDISDQCDAVRCDMAMLMLNPVFERTWSGRVGPTPQLDYWKELIPAVNRHSPDFKFLAEAYWDMEWELQQQGFSYCYDKRLYDRLEHDSAESVRLHLCADPAYQSHLMRFLENHDEPRAAATFADKERAAAVTTLTLTGAKLVHEGQIEGRKMRVPVFLARRPQEPVNKPVRDFYKALLKVTANDVFHNGQWQLCERSGWPDNTSYLNMAAWCWRGDQNRYLVVVNLSDLGSQARVRVPWNDLSGHNWLCKDVLTEESFERSGDEMHEPGLYAALPGWGCHFLQLESH